MRGTPFLPPLSRLSLLLGLIACWHPSPSAPSQGGFLLASASPLNDIITNSLTWCLDTTEVPVPPVGNLTVDCGTALAPVKMVLPSSFDNGGAPIPPSITRLATLTLLNLGNNNIGGNLPPELNQLVNLRLLRLHRNSLTGVLPASLTLIGGLTYLDVSYNQLQGPIPAVYSNFLQLQYLRLQSNLLSGSLPAEIGSLANLIDLELDNNPQGLVGPVPGTWSQLQALTLLHLSYVPLHETFPTALLELTSLLELQLGSTALMGSIPANIGAKFASIQKLVLRKNVLTGPVPLTLDSLLSLTYVDLSYNELFGAVTNPNSRLCVFGNLIKNCFAYTACTNTSITSNTTTNTNSTTNSTTVPDLTATFRAGGCTAPSPAVCDTFGDACTNPLAAVVTSAQQYCSSGGLLDFFSCASGTLLGLDLSKLAVPLNNFQLSIPTLISTLTSLSVLNVPSANITDTIPAFLSVLVKLTQLGLARNSLSGALPAAFTTLTNIGSLALDNNFLSGTIPSFLSTLDLRTLTLNNNQFSGTVPALSTIQNFQLIDVSHNLLYGVVSNKNHPVCLGNLDNNCFSYVACSGTGTGSQDFRKTAACNTTCATCPATCADCNATCSLCAWPLAAVIDAVIKYCATPQFGSAKSGHAGLSCLFGTPFLLDLTQFPKLTMPFDNIGLPIPDTVSLLSDLGALVLDNCDIGGSLPTSLIGLAGIVVLSLGDNSISGTIPTWLSQLGALTELNLNNNDFTGTIPDALGSLQNLGLLQLQYNMLYGTLPLSVVSLPLLGNLFLDHNQLAGSYPVSSTSAANLASGNVLLASNFITGFQSMNESGVAGSCSTFNASLQFNCLNASAPSPFACPVYNSTQRDMTYACTNFCNATAPEGTCGGNGYCYLDAATSVPMCDCFPGFVRDPAHPGRCVSNTTAVVQPSPPPPLINVVRYTGYNQSGPSIVLEKYLNRWSRHLSRGYINVNGAPGWNFLTISNWMAEANQFPPTINLSLPFSWYSVSDQGNCSSCYAHAVADSVAAAVGLAQFIAPPQPSTTAKAPPVGIPELSVGLIQTCGADNQKDPETQTPGCLGGLTPNALDLVAASGLRPAANYSTHPSCPAFRAASAPYQILMYEKVQFSGWFGLMLTVGAQPAVVTIEANYDPFLNWFSNPDHTNVFLDSNCYTGALDHTVLVVGYQMLSPTPYWIIRNSWGPGWGDNGYIRMGMQSAEYTGICGIYVYPAFYPIPAPHPSDPCYFRSYQDSGQSAASMNPCGGGTCTPVHEWGAYSYRCACPIDWINVNNTVEVTALPNAGLGVTQSCVPVDVCKISLYNPCGVGTCVNDGKGGYFCICPLAYVEDELDDGTRLCSYLVTVDDPDEVLSNLTRDANFTVQGPGLSCYEVYVSYGLSLQQFQEQNPNVDCSVALPEGLELDVSNPSYPGCATPYSISQNDHTCDDIASKLGIYAANISSANPGLNCSILVPNLVICAQLGKPQPLYPCLTQYQVSPGDTCTSIIQAQFGTAGALNFFTLNPGINCDNLEAQQGSTTYGQQFVCLQYSDPGTVACKTGKFYVTKLKDNCLSLVKKKIVAKQQDIIPASVCSKDPIPTSTTLCVPKKG